VRVNNGAGAATTGAGLTTGGVTAADPLNKADQKSDNDESTVNAGAGVSSTNGAGGGGGGVGTTTTGGGLVVTTAGIEGTETDGA